MIVTFILMGVRGNQPRIDSFFITYEDQSTSKVRQSLTKVAWSWLPRKRCNFSSPNRPTETESFPSSPVQNGDSEHGMEDRQQEYPRNRWRFVVWRCRVSPEFSVELAASSIPVCLVQNEENEPSCG
jgi:hypothetical protein